MYLATTEVELRLFCDECAKFRISLSLWYQAVNWSRARRLVFQYQEASTFLSSVRVDIREHARRLLRSLKSSAGSEVVSSSFICHAFPLICQDVLSCRISEPVTHCDTSKPPQLVRQIPFILLGRGPSEVRITIHFHETAPV